MIGHQQIINLRQRGMKPHSVFVLIGEHPKFKIDFNDPERALENEFIPTVYTGITDPERIDLTWIKGVRVHLIGGDLKSYMSWWISIINAEPKLLVGIDWDSQVNVWEKA
jgi:hypothetical protein